MNNIKFKSKRFFPRNIGDIMSFGFLVIIIPLVFWFETRTVLPAMYPDFGFWQVYHTIVAILLLFEIVSNFLYIILVDTSIYSVTMPAELKEGWWFCAPCESVAPPRSYHCHMCDVCILKRDHHCRFSACCIGHYNHRYFMLFLFYLTVATIYATYFNLFFILNYINFNWGLLLKVFFPLAFLVFGLDTSTNHVYLVIFIVVLVGSLVSLLLLIYHLTLIQCGVLTFEKNRKLKGYNLGLKANIEQVFGTRWYLVWLGPFVESPLPSNGAKWDLTMDKHVKSL
ncbi:hypothetical protein WDU94_001150 [Cyamophila willieti]